MGGHALGMELRAGPRDAGTNVMADQHRLIGAQGIDQAEQVVDLVAQAVARDRLRRIGVAIAAEIRGNRVIAGGCQRRELMPPGVPELWPAVNQHHQRPRTRLGDMHADPVGFNAPVRDRRLAGRLALGGSHIRSSGNRTGGSELGGAERGRDGEAAEHATARQ